MEIALLGCQIYRNHGVISFQTLNHLFASPIFYVKTITAIFSLVFCLKDKLFENKFRLNNVIALG